MSNVKESTKTEASKHKQSDNGKDEETKKADKLHKQENEKDPSEKDGQTTADPTIEKEKPQKEVPNIKAAYKEEPTKEQKIINYIAGSKTEKVDLVPLLKSLYPLATHSEPAAYQHQGEAKRLRVMLQQMVADGKIVMYDDNYKKLGTNYYAENDPKTKFHTIDSVKIVAVK